MFRPFFVLAVISSFGNAAWGYYTESNSRIGLWQGGAQNLSQAKPSPKQLNLKGWAMQEDLKVCGCPTSPEPILESRGVYSHSAFPQKEEPSSTLSHAFEFPFFSSEFSLSKLRDLFVLTDPDSESIESAPPPPNITWSSPALLFSSPSFEGSAPQLVVHPSLPVASVLWLANGEETAVYQTFYNSASWIEATPINTSPLAQSSLQLSIDSVGNQMAIWTCYEDANLWITGSQNTGLGWEAPFPIFSPQVSDENLFLQLSTFDPLEFLITWQDGDARVHGVTCLNGMLSLPYFASGSNLSILSSILGSTQILLLANGEQYAKPFYTTIHPTNPPPDPHSPFLFPRTVQPTSLHLAYCLDTHTTACIFQDAKTGYLISGILNGASLVYNTIAILPLLVTEAKIAISPVDNCPVAIWRLSDGKIQTSRFSENRWANPTNPLTLSLNGTSPSIAINPANNHVLVIWIDLTAGDNAQTVCVSEFDGTDWSPSTALSSDGFTIGAPRIWINAEGFGAVVWSRKATSSDKAVIEAVTSF